MILQIREFVNGSKKFLLIHSVALALPKLSRIKKQGKLFEGFLRIPTTKEQQAIFFNTHEAIVEDAVFERMQELRANKHRPTKADRQGLFSSLVYCSDCGSKLHFATCKSFNGSQDHYRCAKYKSNTESCTAHFIREEVLKQIVWGRIFDVTALFFDDIMSFHEMMYQQRSAETEKEVKRRKREVGQARKRIAELGRIFKRIYEDDISGAISHDRFLKLSAEYEAEQRELEEKVKADQQEVDTYEQNKRMLYFDDEICII